MTAPLIGITTCTDARGRWHAGRDYHYLHANYARGLTRAGAQVVYVPAQGSADAIAGRLDGLILPGGDDLLPPGGRSELPLDPVPPEQLEFDRALLAAALRLELPVLGICYGAQLLALQHGGTLHYHLPSERPDVGTHRLEEDGALHGIEIERDTHLARALGAAPAGVNSLHHQAIRSVGAGWRIAARADDGVIEAIERIGAPFCLGVQWHPELLEDPSSARLIGAFVRACAAT